MSYVAPSRSGRDAEVADSAVLRWTRILELLSDCGRSLRGQLADRATKLGISEPQLFVLLACGQAPPEGLGQNDLAARLALSAAHTSGLVEQLRGVGLLVGRRSETDRRRQLWRLSAKGRTVLTGLMVELSDWAEQLDRTVDAPQRDDLLALLEELLGRDSRLGREDQASGDRLDMRAYSRERDQA